MRAGGIERRGLDADVTEELPDRSEDGVLVGRGLPGATSGEVTEVGDWSRSSVPGGLLDGQVCIRRNEPVLRKLALLVSGPMVPASPATPVNALSNLLVSSIWLTPSFFISASSASICSSVQVGRPSWTLHPSGTEVSMPMTTASLPC